jgi:hypothetical protein
LGIIDNEKSWSLRADARRRIILYYQTQVSLQETGSEPLGKKTYDFPMVWIHDLHFDATTALNSSA